MKEGSQEQRPADINSAWGDATTSVVRMIDAYDRLYELGEITEFEHAQATQLYFTASAFARRVIMASILRAEEEGSR